MKYMTNILASTLETIHLRLERLSNNYGKRDELLERTSARYGYWLLYDAPKSLRRMPF